MTYYQMLHKDCPRNNWLFQLDINDEPLRYRPEYQRLRCHQCGKLDELDAINRFVPADLSFRSRWNYLGLSDDFGIAVDSVFTSAIAENGISGLRFIALPGDEKYSLIVPTCLMPVEEAIAGFQYEGQKCPACGRYSEAVVGPLIDSITKPSDPMTVFCGNLFNESRIGKRLSLFCTDVVASILKKKRLSGLTLMKAL